MKIYNRVFVFDSIFIVFVMMVSGAWADQVIMVDMMHFIPEKSEYILDADEHGKAMNKAMSQIGNVWDIFKDAKALGGIALGAPGDNNFDTNFPLVYKLPVKINAGEPNKWKMWARLNRVDDPNSFYWKVSQDMEKWDPGSFNIDTHGWNNPAGQIPAKAPWFWFAGIGTPNFKPGDNYLMVSARESGVPPNVNLIDVIMIRNDGVNPTDEEAEKLLSEQYDGIESPLSDKAKAVSPNGKLTGTWGQIRKLF